VNIFAAIDLMGGKVARLVGGRPETAKVYDSFGDPVAVAKNWEKEGASGLHIVDLDAALYKGNNFATILEIARAVKIPIHVGGGIRSEEAAEKILNMGIDKIIIGTLAFRKPEASARLVEKFGDRIIVALDCKENGEVMIEGWRKEAGLNVENAMQKFLKLQVKSFLLTSVDRDGTLKGVCLGIIKKACAYREAKVIAAGGIGSLNDLMLLKDVGVYGVVVGRALYEGTFSLKEALEIISQ